MPVNRAYMVHGLGMTERYKRPCKNAIAQAMRFHFGLRVTRIAALLEMKPQDVSRCTILESWRWGIPWESRRHQDVAINHARKIMEAHGKAEAKA